MSGGDAKGAKIIADLDDKYVHNILRRLTDWNVTEGRWACAFLFLSVFGARA